MNRTGCLVWVVIAIFIYSFRKLLGGIGSFFFVHVDRLLGPSSLSPVILWAVLGLFAGAVAGAFVAYRKFRLSPVVVVVPFAALVLFCFSAALLSEARPVAEAVIGVGAEGKITRNVTAGLMAGVSASSELPSGDGQRYEAGNLMDVKRSTAWIENGSGAGINETVTFLFKGGMMKDIEELTCTGFRIRNGFQKSAKLWRDHNRLKDFSVSHSSGKVIYLMARDLQDEAEEIRFPSPIRVKNGDRLIVSIISVYYGNNHPDRTAVSELVPLVDVVMR